MQTQGGGNCANALTAAARLGLKPFLITKIGDDGIGDGIVSELQNDGVSTDFVLRKRGMPSPFTYIIVDREGMLPTIFCCDKEPKPSLESVGESCTIGVNNVFLCELQWLRGDQDMHSYSS